VGHRLGGERWLGIHRCNGFLVQYRPYRFLNSVDPDAPGP
jgi:hypothetical protein